MCYMYYFTTDLIQSQFFLWHNELSVKFDKRFVIILLLRWQICRFYLLKMEKIGALLNSTLAMNWDYNFCVVCKVELTYTYELGGHSLLAQLFQS